MNNNFVFMIVSIILIVFSIGLAIWALTGIIYGQEKEDDDLEIYKDYCESYGGNMTEKEGCEYNNNNNYQFVKCPNDTNTYPENTNCDSTNNKIQEPLESTQKGDKP